MKMQQKRAKNKSLLIGNPTGNLEQIQGITSGASDLGNQMNQPKQTDS